MHPSLLKVYVDEVAWQAKQGHAAFERLSDLSDKTLEHAHREARKNFGSSGSDADLDRAAAHLVSIGYEISVHRDELLINSDIFLWRAAAVSLLLNPTRVKRKPKETSEARDARQKWAQGRGAALCEELGLQLDVLAKRTVRDSIVHVDERIDGLMMPVDAELRSRSEQYREVRFLVGDRDVLVEAQMKAGEEFVNRRLLTVDTLTYHFGDDRLDLRAADNELRTISPRAGEWLHTYGQSQAEATMQEHGLVEPAGPEQASPPASTIAVYLRRGSEQKRQA